MSYVNFEDNLYQNSECTHWFLYLQFMVLKGLVSVSISLNFFVLYTWTNVVFLPNRGLKGLVYLFEIYTQNIIILFFFLRSFVKRVPLCNQYLHVMLYQMKLIKLSLKRGFYLSTSVLPLLGPGKQSNPI